MHRTLLPLLIVASLACGSCTGKYSGENRQTVSIACSDWTHNADGTWTSSASATPVTVYGTTQTLQSTTIGRGTTAMGNPPTDLWAVINDRCGTK